MTTADRAEGSYAAFRTYMGYIRSWRYLTNNSGSDRWKSSSAPVLAAKTEARVNDSLRRSKQHLRALKVLNDEDLTTEVLDAHLPIAYYAVYHGLIAMLSSHGVTVGPTHEKVLAQIATMQKSPSQALPEPWSALCFGDPKAPSFTGKLQGVRLPLSNLSTPGHGEMESFAALSLKTTHAVRRDDLARKRRGNRKRLGKGEPAAIVARMRATTVFDLLYRYRRIAHYGHSADFVSFGEDEEARQFAGALLVVTQNTCEVLGNRAKANIP